MIRKQWVTTDGTVFDNEYKAKEHENTWKKHQNRAADFDAAQWFLIQNKKDYEEAFEKFDADGEKMIHSCTKNVAVPYILYVLQDEDRNGGTPMTVKVFPYPASDVKEYANSLLGMVDYLEKARRMQFFGV